MKIRKGDRIEEVLIKSPQIKVITEEAPPVGEAKKYLDGLAAEQAKEKSKGGDTAKPTPGHSGGASGGGNAPKQN